MNMKIVFKMKASEFRLLCKTCEVDATLRRAEGIIMSPDEKD